MGNALSHFLYRWQNGVPLRPIALEPLAVPSGAGTNLKMGAPVRRRASEKNFLVVPLHFFGFKSTISRFSGCIRDGQYSLVSFLFCCFSTHGAPPYPVPFVKVGARAPVPYGVDATGCNTFFKWSAPLTKF